MTGHPDSPVRFAFVGCGAIAHKHHRALSRIPDARLVGVYDLQETVAARFAHQYGVPAFATSDALIQEAQPDFLCILTPSGAHADTVLDLVKHNRHFVIEKPLALQLSDADRILYECAQRELRVYVVKQNRFNPPIQQLKRAINEGRFGKMVLGTVRVRWTRDQKYYDQNPWRGTWQADGGVLTNQASHHIDALLWLMGDVELVSAMTATRLVDIEAEDTGAAVVRFSNGALGIIEATTATRPKDLEGSISILGERGSVEVGGFFMNKLKTWNFIEPTEQDKQICKQHAHVPDVSAWNHTEYYKNVITSFRTGKRGLVDGLEGRKSIELINALYESVESGEQVSLRFRPRLCRLGTQRDDQIQAPLHDRAA